MGSGLVRIRDEKLYLARHDSFHGYCLARWNITRTYAHRLIEAAKAAENVFKLETRVHPERESQVRPLIRLSPEQQRQAWALAEEKATGKKVTAKLVKLAVEEVLRGTGEPMAPAQVRDLVRETLESQEGPSPVTPRVEKEMQEKGGHGWERSNIALHRATWKRDHAKMERILEEKADPDATDGNGVQAVDLAIYLNDPEAVLVLRKHGANVRKWKDPVGQAVACGNLDVLRVLLEQKVELPQVPDELERAARLERIDLVRLLIDSGRWAEDTLAALLPTMRAPFLAQCMAYLKEVLSQRRLDDALILPFKETAAKSLKGAAIILAHMSVLPSGDTGFSEAVESVRKAERRSAQELEGRFAELYRGYRHAESQSAQRKVRLAELEKQVRQVRQDLERAEQEEGSIREELLSVAEFLYWGKSGNPRR